MERGIAFLAFQETRLFPKSNWNSVLNLLSKFHRQRNSKLLEKSLWKPKTPYKNHGQLII